MTNEETIVPENYASEIESAETTETKTKQPRRGFLTEALAIIIGGIAGLFPTIVGLAVFLDPLRSRKKDGEASASDGFLKVAMVDGLPVGKPRRYTVVDDRVDAWNLFPQEQVGAVYLMKNEDNSITALNVKCPHLGCAVEFIADREVYQCPCHNSSFKPDGEIANEGSPSARALDSLEVDSERLKQGEVWVKYENFRASTAEKIAE